MKKLNNLLSIVLIVSIRFTSIAQQIAEGDTAFIHVISANESFIRQGINSGYAPPINIGINIILLNEKITSLDSINIRGTTRCLKEGSNRERKREHFSVPFVTKGEKVWIQTDPVGDFNINYCRASDYKAPEKRTYKNNVNAKPPSIEEKKPTLLYFSVEGSTKFISFYMAPASPKNRRGGPQVPSMNH